MEIEYTAPDNVRHVIASLGRTEDVRFSPSNRRLAVAAYIRNRIAILDIEIGGSGNTRRVALSGIAEFSSACLKQPHGLDFIDEETLVVANRKGDVAVFKLPATGSSADELAPVLVMEAGHGSLLSEPGSVSVSAADGAFCELLICNNSGHSVTRHVLDRDAGYAIVSSEVLLRKWLNLPDGVCIGDDPQWIAVSNHNTHNVLLYQRSPGLNEHASPDGVLRGLFFPHGLRFSLDGRHIFVADAGAPFVHIYACGSEGWRGARSPVASLRIMDEELFRRGRQNPQEGGPKGIDLDRGMSVLAATSEHQPLVFFDLPAILENLPAAPPVQSVEYEFGILQQAERLQIRAIAAEARAAKAEKQLRKNKSKWLPKRLRRLYSALRRPN